MSIPAELPEGFTRERAEQWGLNRVLVVDKSHARLVFGVPNRDPISRAVQLGTGPESGEIDFQIRHQRGRAFLTVLTLRAMRWLERRFFSSYPLPPGVYRRTTFTLPAVQTELAQAQISAAGLKIVTVQ